MILISTQARATIIWVKLKLVGYPVSMKHTVLWPISFPNIWRRKKKMSNFKNIKFRRRNLL